VIQKEKVSGRAFFASLRRAKCSRSMRSLAAGLVKGLCVGLTAVAFFPHQVAAADKAVQIFSPASPLSAHQTAAPGLASGASPDGDVSSHPKRANFGQEPKSRDAGKVADWVVDSGDNSGMPFLILDKVDAKVFVFDTDGTLRGAAPALLGRGKGDDAVPGVGDRKMSEIRPKDRTTPAGRFVALLGVNHNGTDVLWVDYDGAVALHRVVTHNPKERRLERLATSTPLDNRISYGCINVPAKFYDDVVKPLFTGTYGVVYILPETRSCSETFRAFYDVDVRRGTGATAKLDEATEAGLQQQDKKVGGKKARP